MEFSIRRSYWICGLLEVGVPPKSFSIASSEVTIAKVPQWGIRLDLRAGHFFSNCMNLFFPVDADAVVFALVNLIQVNNFSCFKLLSCPCLELAVAFTGSVASIWSDNPNNYYDCFRSHML